MKNRNKISGLVIIAFALSLLVVAIPQAKAQFVLSSWDHNDEHGQGIDRIDLYENTTDSWVNIENPVYYYDSGLVDWNASVFIKLSVWAYFNSSFMGIDDDVEGRNYQRHNVSVIQSNGTIVFSQNNFTYVTVETFLTPPLWHYCYEVILDFIPEYGQIYTVSVTYEIYEVK